MTKGQRINNPGCIRGDIPWLGRTGLDETNHVIFDTLSHGCRALWRVIQQKLMAGNDTPLEFCRSYAWAGDTQGSIPGGKPNEPDKYADFVSRNLGVSCHDELTAFDKQGYLVNIDEAVRLFRSICRYENAGWTPPLSDMFEGLAMFLRDKVEK